MAESRACLMLATRSWCAMVCAMYSVAGVAIRITTIRIINKWQLGWPLLSSANLFVLTITFTSTTSLMTNEYGYECTGARDGFQQDGSRKSETLQLLWAEDDHRILVPYMGSGDLEYEKKYRSMSKLAHMWTSHLASGSYLSFEADYCKVGNLVEIRKNIIYKQRFTVK